ncbi:MAG: 16S rRNA (guanine(527)-N(7))-methyltransferase RsmG [Rhizobiales bacterium]|nr:16S rRNA (guanine(527)-N(7))-methyltransferase RsmG [Hyphomicrobiales bacterium]
MAVSRETASTLDALAALVRRWQSVRNLVAPSTLPQLWTRHVLDSAQLVALAADTASRWVDLGSGGGFPGLVVASMLKRRSGFRITLVESDQRKAAFLRTAARELGLPVDVRADRIETVVPTLGSCDVVSARALAPLPTLLDMAGPLLEGGAVGLFPQGEQATSELTDFGPAGKFAITLTPSVTHPSAAIAVVKARGS